MKIDNLKYEHAVFMHAFKNELSFCLNLLQQQPDLLSKKTTEGYALIHVAAAGNAFDVVKWLIEEKQQTVDLVDENNHPAMTHAVMHGSLDVAKLLYDKKANLMLLTELGQHHELLLAASYNNQLTMLCWLLEKLKMLLMERFLTEMANHIFVAALYATIKGNKDILIELAKENPNIFNAAAGQDSLMNCAVSEGHLHLVQWLIESGVELCVNNVRNEVPLKVALGKDNVPIAKELWRAMVQQGFPAPSNLTPDEEMLLLQIIDDLKQEEARADQCYATGYALAEYLPLCLLGYSSSQRRSKDHVIDFQKAPSHS